MAVPDNIDPAELQRILRLGFGHDAADPDRWRVELLALPKVAGLPTVGIWRVAGDDWSMILKLLRDSDDRTAQWGSHPLPDHPYYWKREALAFQGSVLADLSGGLRAPRCYGVVERPDGSVAVWMEDVTGTSATDWELERYRRAAHQLGIAQGTLLDAKAPADEWLSRRYIRTYVERRRNQTNVEPADWQHPNVQPLLANLDPEAVRQFWSNSEHYLEIVESLPRTLCHLDLHPLNMFDVGGDTVLIDWAFAGLGGIGEDIGTLVIDAAADFHVAPDRLGELFDLLVDGYATGLAEADGEKNRAAVRRACIAGAAARYFWIPMALVRTLADERTTINQRPTAEALPYWMAASQYLLELSAELG